MAFHEQHPYLGVFFFLAIFGCLAFLQFYRFGYISAKVRIAASFSPQGSSGLHRRCSAVPLHVCTCACGELRAACCVLRDKSHFWRVLYVSKLWLVRLRSWER